MFHQRNIPSLGRHLGPHPLYNPGAGSVGHVGGKHGGTSAVDGGEGGQDGLGGRVQVLVDYSHAEEEVQGCGEMGEGEVVKGRRQVGDKVNKSQVIRVEWVAVIRRREKTLRPN